MVVRAQTDQQIAELPEPQEPLCWQDQKAALQNDLTRARRLITLLRAEKAHLLVRVAEEKRAAEFFKSLLKSIRETLKATDRNWRRCSRMIRDLVSPAAVAEWRQDNPE